jgi:hypothetical protein
MQRTEELSVRPLRVPACVLQKESLFVGDDWDRAEALLVFCTAHEDLTTACEILRDVRSQRVVQRTQFGPRRQRERRRCRNIGRKMPEDPRCVLPRDCVSLLRRSRLEVWRDEAIEIPRPEPPRLRHRERHLQRAQLSFDRAIRDRDLSGRQTTTRIDVHPRESRIFEGGDRPIVPEYRDEGTNFVLEELDVLAARPHATIVKKCQQAVV